jgi:hypothetical protein
MNLHQRTDMKKPITGLVTLLAGAFMAHSQGWISFGDYTFRGTGFQTIPNYMYVSLGSTRLGGAATSSQPPTLSNYASETADGDDWTVALYGAPGASDAPSVLAPLIALNTGAPIEANLADGTINSTIGTWYCNEFAVVPGAYATQIATFQVYAWYNEGGMLPTYSAAWLAGVPTGFSVTGNGTLGGLYQYGGAPLVPNDMPYLGNIVLTTAPEPSTIALGLIASIPFLMHLRPTPNSEPTK